MVTHWVSKLRMNFYHSNECVDFNCEMCITISHPFPFKVVFELEDDLELVILLPPFPLSAGITAGVLHLILVKLGIEPRALYSLGRHCTT